MKTTDMAAKMNTRTKQQRAVYRILNAHTDGTVIRLQGTGRGRIFLAIQDSGFLGKTTCYVIGTRGKVTVR